MYKHGSSFGKYAASIFSSILLVLSFPPYSVWPLVFIGLVPFLIALNFARSYRQVFFIGTSCSIPFILLGFPWVADVAVEFGSLPWIVGKLILLGYSLFGEIEFLIFAFAVYFVLNCVQLIHSKVVKIITYFVVLPAFYVGFDWLYPKIFPNTLGHVLYDWFSVIQITEYIGAFGLTFFIVEINLALAVLSLVAFYTHKKSVFTQGVFVKSAAIVLCICTASLLVFSFWGKSRILELEKISQGFNKKFKVSIIQANIGDIDKIASESGSRSAIQKVLNTYKEMSLLSVKRFHPDLVIWPETAYPLLYTHFKDENANAYGSANDAWIKDLSGQLKTPLYFGGYSARNGRDFNSAFLVTPAAELVGFYQKTILLPFGEYIPLGPLSVFISNFIPAIADFGRGAGSAVIPFNGIKLGPQICYEGIIPEHSRQAVHQGANVLLNITNDSWFGNSAEPWLHLRLTAMRSIELRKPLIRATNTGVSTVVDITGKMTQVTRLFQPEILEAEILVPQGEAAPQTFYFRYGEVFAFICVWIGFIGMLFVVLRVRYRV